MDEHVRGVRARAPRLQMRRRPKHDPPPVARLGSFGSGEGRNRTGDTTVFSRVLYRLSYLAGASQSTPALHERGMSPEAGLPAGRPHAVGQCMTEKDGARGEPWIPPRNGREAQHESGVRSEAWS